MPEKIYERNQAQKEAIAHLAGPMLVLAGPGSGKTSVIVERTARMCGSGRIAPDQILVVTFSRMAAEGMKKRFLSYTRQETTRVTFGTFHSVFFFILSQAYGLGPGNILKEEERGRILRGLLIENGGEQLLEGELWRELLKEISTVKGNRIRLKHFHSAICPDDLFNRIFQQYQDSMKKQRKLDFDDMLLDCYELFMRRPDILARWRKKYAYILVDEFQDINPLQYDVLRLLAAPENNLFAVGDDDQSIYRFRGSSPAIMLSFEKDFPGAKRVLLNVNYRCSGNILDTAAQVIRNNRQRFSKTLSTPNEPGPPVSVRIYKTSREECAWLVRELENRREAGDALTDTAVLFRTNQEAEELVKQLMDRGIPFTMRDRLPNLYDHWVSRDILSYLRLAEAVKTAKRSSRRVLLPREAFLIVMNHPNRYFSREAVSFASVSEGTDPALKVDPERLLLYYREKAWLRQRVEVYLQELETLSVLPPFAAVNYVRNGMGYEAFLKEQASTTGRNVEDLLQVLSGLQEEARSLPSLQAWEKGIREYREKLMDQARRQKEKNEGVTLSTLHASKGLEYDQVMILNVNEGQIPFRKALLPEAIEEERRLFYVGMTRARSRLTLCLVCRRNENPAAPSRFLFEAGYHAP